jgi:hypothetical protein
MPLPEDGNVRAFKWGVGERGSTQRFKGVGWGEAIIGKWDTVANGTMLDEVEVARRMACTKDPVVGRLFRPYLFTGVVPYSELLRMYCGKSPRTVCDPNTEVRLLFMCLNLGPCMLS